MAGIATLSVSALRYEPMRRGNSIRASHGMSPRRHPQARKRQSTEHVARHNVHSQTCQMSMSRREKAASGPFSTNTSTDMQNTSLKSSEKSTATEVYEEGGDNGGQSQDCLCMAVPGDPDGQSVDGSIARGVVSLTGLNDMSCVCVPHTGHIRFPLRVSSAVAVHVKNFAG